MEKFRIFELLDALSALTANESQAPPARQQAPQDAANAPADTPAAQQTHGGQTAQMQTDALQAFLARHDALSKRVKK